jgi:AcrR family transcriptional regulator
MEATAGLRERKKQRTREAIVEAALELFAERGFEGTTVAQIADAAEIAPRTFFSYFPSKDDVVFHDFEEQYALVSSWLSEREPGANTFDALRAGIARTFAEQGTAGPELEWKTLRHKLIRENASLAAHSDHLHGKFAELVRDSVAEDLGDAPTDLRPRLVAAAMIAAMDVVDELSEEDAAERSRATFENLLAFLQGGLAALQEQDVSRAE